MMRRKTILTTTVTNNPIINKLRIGIQEGAHPDRLIDLVDLMEHRFSDFRLALGSEMDCKNRAQKVAAHFQSIFHGNVCGTRCRCAEESRKALE